MSWQLRPSVSSVGLNETWGEEPVPRLRKHGSISANNGSTINRTVITVNSSVINSTAKSVNGSITDKMGRHGR